MTLLAATGIEKSYSGVHALRGVSFEVRAGEVHALVGENGAGKSTLIRILTGAETPDAGAIEIAGTREARIDPARARALGIAAVYQQPALFPDLTVAENIAFAIDPPKFFRRVDRRAQRRHAAKLLDRIGAPLDPERPARTLAMPEQQIVEIAKAIGANARLLILDEPTASLTDREVDHLFAIIRRLRAGGTGIVYVSHRLAEVLSLADRITALRDGQAVTTAAASELTVEALVAAMAGRAVGSTASPTPGSAAGATVLEVTGLCNAESGLDDISFEVRAGEIVGIGGLVGAGRTEVAETLFGLRRATRGTIAVRGRPLVLRSPADAIAAGIGYLPEDRRRHGIIGDLSIAENTSLASLPALARFGLVNRRREAALAESYRRQLRIRAPSVAVPVADLSGGNQQKVALARWLVTSPAVLLLDEPTQGVDVGAKAEIHALIQALAAQGLAIVLISSELSELLALSDRILVLRAGRMAGLLDRTEATRERVLRLAVAPAEAAG